MMGLVPVLQALGSRPTPKLRLRHCFVKGTEARPPDSTVTLEACRVLFFSGSDAELAELAPAVPQHVHQRA
jgi:hypothetical protein